MESICIQYHRVGRNPSDMKVESLCFLTRPAPQIAWDGDSGAPCPMFESSAAAAPELPRSTCSMAYHTSTLYGTVTFQRGLSFRSPSLPRQEWRQARYFQPSVGNVIVEEYDEALQQHIADSNMKFSM